MKLRYFLLTVIALCGILPAQAQTLVIYDARDLFPKDAWNPPCKAVFTEDYYYSEEWQSLNERINSYLLYQEAKGRDNHSVRVFIIFRRFLAIVDTISETERISCKMSSPLAITRHLLDLRGQAPLRLLQRRLQVSVPFSPGTCGRGQWQCQAAVIHPLLR